MIEINPNIRINEIKLQGHNKLANIYLAQISEGNIMIQYHLIKPLDVSKDILNINMKNVLTIQGVDPNSGYPSDNPDGKICELDPFLKEEHFGPIYNKYGLNVNSVIKIDEGLLLSYDFTIDPRVDSKLRNIIIEEYKKM